MSSLNPINLSAPLGRKNAAHLLRRTTFGPARADIDTFSNYNIDQALAIILEEKPPADPPVDVLTGASWVNPKPTGANSESGVLMDMTFAWWFNLMRTSGNSIIDRISWFYHTHFTTISSRINRGTAIYYQIKLFRHYALGSFKELCKKICYDNAMLVHLDGRLNDVGRPNENFAREFFELYTIGKGDQVGPDDYTTFTEQDVIEASKVLSGWNTDWDYGNIDADTGVAMGILRGSGNEASNHDASVKAFSSRFQGTTIQPDELIGDKATKDAALGEIDQLVNMIFDQEATARYICRRLYRFFGYYDITDEIENDIIGPLAQTFIASDFEMKPVLEQFFRSQHFFDSDNATETDDNRGGIIKSPLEVVLGSLRFFKITLPDPVSNLGSFYDAAYDLVFGKLGNQGLDFYEPFEVAGYRAYHQAPVYNRNWITANNLARRYQISTDLLLGYKDENDQVLYRLDILQYCQSEGIDLNSPQSIVAFFVDYMLPEDITQERFNHFKSTLLVDVEEADWVSTIINGEDFQVVFHLENLINALIQSPEYQLF
ncbi:MAG: DUF1800 domain-containing protein [Cytophagales bacterium]|nr:DUF1800 domain-containing protein [Cytophagales bacterium]